MFQLIPTNVEFGLKMHPVDLRSLPFVIGRESAADFQIEGPGVWERHATIALSDDSRPVVLLRNEASCMVNDELVQNSKVLKPGDTLKFGEALLRFDLSSCLQKSSFLQESCVYVLTGLFIVSQFVCVYLFLGG